MTVCRRCDYQAADRDDDVQHARESGHPLCIACARSLEQDERQTCVRCLGAARRNLRSIVELYAMLPEETTERGGTSFDPVVRGTSDPPPPGGDALVMLAGGSVSARDPEARPDDPVPPLALLASWEDDWRHVRGEAAGGRAIMAATASYLDTRLGWAAQHHPAFDEFADDLRRSRAQLEALLRTGPQLSPVPCLTCGRRALERPTPADTDQEIEVLWQCGSCHRRYTGPEYWMAVREQMEAAS